MRSLTFELVRKMLPSTSRDFGGMHIEPLQVDAWGRVRVRTGATLVIFRHVIVLPRNTP